MLDAQLLLRAAAAGALSANEATPTGKYMGADGRDMQYSVYVPSVSGTNPTLDITIQEAPDNAGSPGTYYDVAKFKQITAAGFYVVSARCDQPWRRYTATVGGTTPNFGTVIIGPEMGGQYDKV